MYYQARIVLPVTFYMENIRKMILLYTGTAGWANHAIRAIINCTTYRHPEAQTGTHPTDRPPAPKRQHDRAEEHPKGQLDRPSPLPGLVALVLMTAARTAAGCLRTSTPSVIVSVVR